MEKAISSIFCVYFLFITFTFNFLFSYALGRTCCEAETYSGNCYYAGGGRCKCLEPPGLQEPGHSCRMLKDRESCGPDSECDHCNNINCSVFDNSRQPCTIYRNYRLLEDGKCNPDGYCILDPDSTQDEAPVDTHHPI